jgi:hypothetical protein
MIDAERFHGLGLLTLAARLHIINHLVLSPELENVVHMRTLVDRLLARGVRHLHLTFHSSTLHAGLNPFAQTEADVERFRDRVLRILDYIGSRAPVRYATVGEAADLLAPPVDERTGPARGDSHNGHRSS